MVQEAVRNNALNVEQRNQSDKSKKYWERIKKYIGHQEPNINAKFHNLEKKSHNLINTDTEVFMEAAVLAGISLWCVHHKCDIGGSSL